MSDDRHATSGVKTDPEPVPTGAPGHVGARAVRDSATAVCIEHDDPREVDVDLSEQCLEVRILVLMIKEPPQMLVAEGDIQSGR